MTAIREVHYYDIVTQDIGNFVTQINKRPKAAGKWIKQLSLFPDMEDLGIHTSLHQKT